MNVEEPHPHALGESSLPLYGLVTTLRDKSATTFEEFTTCASSSESGPLRTLPKCNDSPTLQHKEHQASEEVQSFSDTPLLESTHPPDEAWPHKDVRHPEEALSFEWVQSIVETQQAGDVGVPSGVQLPEVRLSHDLESQLPAIDNQERQAPPFRSEERTSPNDAATKLQSLAVNKSEPQFLLLNSRLVMLHQHEVSSKSFPKATSSNFEVFDQGKSTTRVSKGLQRISSPEEEASNFAVNVDNSEQDPVYVLSIVVVRDPLAGKTQLVNRFGNDAFSSTWSGRPSRQATDIINVSLGDDQVALRVMEITDEQDFGREWASLYGPYSDPFVILICFAMNDLDTFDNARAHWHPEISQHCPHVPRILVETMLDMYDEQAVTSHRFSQSHSRHVVDTRAEEVLAKIDGKKYLTCSAKVGVGVSEVFQFTINTALLERRQKPEMKKRSLGQSLRRW